MVMSGLAPPSTVMRLASRRRVPLCGINQPRNASGSATVARQADRFEPGRQRPQPRQTQRQQIAALVGHQRVQFVEDDGVEIGEETVGVGRRHQQRDLLGCRHENVRRIELLAPPLVHRGVAGTGFQLHRKPHLGHRALEIARDVDRQRLQRGDIEGMDPVTADRGFLRPVMQGDQRRQESRQRLAGAGGGDQQRRSSGGRPGQKFDLVGPRAPAARGEPRRKRRRQDRLRRFDVGQSGHGHRGNATVAGGPSRTVAAAAPGRGGRSAGQHLC